MIFFLIILLLIAVRSATIAAQDQFNKNYLSKIDANNIKGIFVILIIFSHYVGYVQLGGRYDQPYLALREHLNQMVVAMFWFYSGYGIMTSMQRKNKGYLKGILMRRFPKVWASLAAAVGIFMLVNLITGRQYPVGQIMLSLIGWESIGNSNWYMFDTLVIYLLVYLSFSMVKFRSKKVQEYVGCAFLTVLTGVFIYTLMKVGKENYWYNSVIIFPVGCWYALLKDKIESIFMKNDRFYMGGALLAVLIYSISFRNRWKYGIEGYTVWAVAFVAVIVLFTMKVSISSHIFTWFGEHVFSVYMLQRIPMIIFSDLGFARNKYMFLVICIISTVFLADLFDRYIGEKIKRVFA